MPRFFVDSLPDSLLLTGESARHAARSLRMRAGDSLMLCDGAGTDAEAVIEQIDDAGLHLRILRRFASATEPELQVTLFQALPKSDKLEHIIQKTTELGVTAIQPFLSRYCVSRPAEFDKKLPRFAKIATEAAKQSGRGRIPAVLPLIKLPDIPDRMQNFDAVLLCYERAEQPLSQVLKALPVCRRVAVIVGSEGGFAPEEADCLTAAGAYSCLMGPRILRCETAPVAALSALMLWAEEM
jgi:16S rRNA (uracil1498-N3)-methyltransferase